MMHLAPRLPHVALRGSSLQARAPTRQQQQRRHVAVAANRLVLEPCGSGSTEHLNLADIPLPGALVLADGAMMELGREEPADLIVPLPTVSARHAILKVEGGRVSVTDLNSTNGTYVGGRQVLPMQVVNVMVGDEIIFGDLHLAKYRLESQPEEGAKGVASDGNAIDV